MAVPPLSANIQIQADHSCNWHCCFGCKEPKTPVNSPSSRTEIEEDIVHRVTKVYHSHKMPRVDTSQMSPEDPGSEISARRQGIDC